jgi:DNA/RNA-binding domain of Phe-tRNA-synthetase-like protein
MLWKNKVLELVIEGNERSKALGQEAGRFLAIARGIDITKEEDLPTYKKLLAKALKNIIQGFRAARQDTKEEDHDE